MPLMKEQAAGRISHEAIVLDLGDLRRQGEQLKRRAQAEADRILAEARAEAARLTADADAVGRQAGRGRGLAEGLAQGRREGHAEALQQVAERLEALQAAWAAAIERWEQDRRGMVLDARQSLLELALAVAEKIVRRMPAVDPSVVVEQVAAAVEHVIRPGDIAVRVHPDDRALVEEALPGIAHACAAAEHIRLRDDAGVGRGGCVVTTGRGCIDATLERQLDRLVAALLPGRAGRADEPAGDGGSAEA